MKKNYFFGFVFVITALLFGCSSSSDDGSISQSNVNVALKTYRAYLPDVDDLYYEYEKRMIDDDMVVSMI